MYFTKAFFFFFILSCKINVLASQMICINITMKRPQVARIVMTLAAGDFSLTLARKLPVVGEFKNLWFFSGEYFKIKSRKTVTFLKMC